MRPARWAPAARAAARISRATVSALATIGRARLAGARDPRATAARLQGAAAEMVAIHGLDVTVRGAWPAAPAVIVANHVSYLDPLVIAAHLPCSPVSKGEVARWPVIGAAARGLGVNFVDRGCAWSGARAIRRALGVLAAGACVLNFPEGTTTDGTTLLPFRRGAFGIARLAGVPIVPVALRYTPAELAWHGGATFVPHYLRTAARPRPAVHVELGAALLPDRGRSADDLAWLTHQRIARMLRDLEDPHGSILRLRVPAARPDAVLPAARRRAAGY